MTSDDEKESVRRIPKQNMKTLHWKRIDDRFLKKHPNSIWNDIDDRSLDIDFEKLEGHLQEMTTKKLGKMRKNMAEQKQVDDEKEAENMKMLKSRGRIGFIADLEVGETVILSLQNARERYIAVNAALFLEKRSFSDIRRWILDLNEDHLTKDDILKFYRAAPTENEVKALCQEVAKQKWTERDWQRFEKAEAFWWSLKDIPKIREWLAMWLYKLEFQDITDDQERRVQVLKDAMKQIVTSKKLKVILSVILGVGNHLNALNALNAENGQNQKSRASAFGLGVLAILQSVRGLDGRYSLLHFIYEQVMERYPESENFEDELDLVVTASKEEIKWLRREFEKQEVKLNIMKRQISGPSATGQQVVTVVVTRCFVKRYFSRKR